MIMKGIILTCRKKDEGFIGPFSDNITTDISVFYPTRLREFDPIQLMRCSGNYSAFRLYILSQHQRRERQYYS
ncbi:hypothetical protein A8U91_02046 [Halomonas elongata]|uniref:Uncharacterized protein n=1 Tax=Halomonas elongata TaxID=2746 RepID=A0A1B8P5Z8_HALEL|nr:hypothetical protein A8U91_02046 [Halomonas elongata]